MKQILLLSILLIINIANGNTTGQPVAKSCNCVAWRMDDVQDYYFSQPLVDTFNTFKTHNIPISGVIIGADFGQDQLVVDYLKTALSQTAWDFEAGNHGWTHEYFSNYTLAEQINRFSLAINATLKVLEGYLTKEQFTTFVPPYNDFNDNTLKAMQAVGFNLISSEYDMDSYAFPGPDTYGNYHWPNGAALTDLSDTYEISGQATFDAIKSQMDTYGFAVVMMHPDDFGLEDGTTNASAIANIESLFEMVSSAGYTHTNLRGLNSLWFGTGVTTGAVSITTGAVPITTGAPVTTGITTQVPVTTGVAPITTGVASITTGVTTGVAPITTGVESVTTGSPITTGSPKSIFGTTGAQGSTPIVNQQEPSQTSSSSILSPMFIVVLLAYLLL